MEHNQYTLLKERKGIPAVASIFIYMGLFLVLISLFSVVIYALWGPSVAQGGVHSYSMYQLSILQLSTFISALVPALFLLRFLDHRPFSDLGFGMKGRGKDILYGMLMAMVLYGVGFGCSLALGVVEVVDFQWNPLQLLSSFFFFILVALTEEMMVRGYLLGRMLRTRINKFLALFISSLIFACMHLLNPHVTWLSMLNLVLAGMLLGVSYLYTRNLWFPISLHLFWNWIQGSVLGYEVSGNQFGGSLLKLQLSNQTMINGGAFGFEGSIVCTVLELILIGSLIWWFEKSLTHR